MNLSTDRSETDPIQALSGSETALSDSGKAPSTSETALWLHCFSGVSGDMLLGGLVDSGVDIGQVETELKKLPFKGWKLSANKVMRGGIASTSVNVTVDDPVTVRSYTDIVNMIATSSLSPKVVKRSLACFRILAEAESTVHSGDIGSTHFHEVGGHDAIIDIVGTMVAVEILGTAKVYSSGVALGLGGALSGAHGHLPNPAPAVLRILEKVPVYGRSLPYELTTPTGAAILRTLVDSYGPIPPMNIVASGYGAGDREIEELPNLLQVIVGESAGDQENTAGSGMDAMLIETNVDDVSGEAMAWAISSLMDAGAYDAWVTPVVAKKGRPGFVASVLCDPSSAAYLRDILRRETGTLGVRGIMVQRWPSARDEMIVSVKGFPVRTKVAGHRVKIEQSDAAKVAAETGMPLREVILQAEYLVQCIDRQPR